MFEPQFVGMGFDVVERGRDRPDSTTTLNKEQNAPSPPKMSPERPQERSLSVDSRRRSIIKLSAIQANFDLTNLAKLGDVEGKEKALRDGHVQN